MGSGEGHIGPVRDSAGAGCQALLSALLRAQIRRPGSPMRWALVVSAVLLKYKMGVCVCNLVCGFTAQFMIAGPQQPGTEPPTPACWPTATGGSRGAVGAGQELGEHGYHRSTWVGIPTGP